jgi:GH25 family lysozyme M1 (1,4-beta-N-acetylmuramidase)
MDVSGWQTLTLSDWNTAYANGARFVYIKATESTDYVSGEFSEQYADSAAAGMVRGAYHFAIPNASSGAAQASYFVSHGGGWTPDGRTLPPMLDIEYNTNKNQDTCYGMAGAAMVSWIRDFSNTVLSLTGRLPAIYSTTDWWSRCTGNSSSFSENPLFIARYPNDLGSGAGTLPNGWTSYTFWQYADSGIFPGDQDVYNGGESDLATFARTTSAPFPSPIIANSDFNGDGIPDALARRPDGTLWFSPGAANGVYGASVAVSQGWSAYNLIIGPGDLNGDGIPDLLARDPSGNLTFFAGKGTTGSGGQWSSGLQSGLNISSGWRSFTAIIACGDLNGDQKPDLLARDLSGNLVFFAGSGTTGSSGQWSSGLQSGLSISAGWSGYDMIVGAGDLNHDGHNDLVARQPGGALIYFSGTGSTGKGGAWSSGLNSGWQIGSGWNVYDVIISAGDLNRDGTADLMARTPSGGLYFYAGTGHTGLASSGLTPAVPVASGWSTYDPIVAAGDLNGDGKADLLERLPDGSMSFSAGTSAGSLARAVPISQGWAGYNLIVGAGDLNNDGVSDILARDGSGNLTFFAGKGTTGTGGAWSSGLNPGVPVSAGWSGFKAIIAPGDMNGDGKPDLLAEDYDGNLIFFAGTGRTGVGGEWSSGFGSGVPVSAGWNGFSSVVGVGDMDGDGHPDLMATSADGTLSFFPGTGATGAGGAWSSGLRSDGQIGSGWNAYKTVLGAGDLNGDKRPDIVARDYGGNLYFYAGLGSTQGYSNGLRPAVQIGSGWDVYA